MRTAGRSVRVTKASMTTRSGPATREAPSRTMRLKAASPWPNNSPRSRVASGSLSPSRASIARRRRSAMSKVWRIPPSRRFVRAASSVTFPADLSPSCFGLPRIWMRPGGAESLGCAAVRPWPSGSFAGAKRAQPQIRRLLRWTPIPGGTRAGRAYSRRNRGVAGANRASSKRMLATSRP